MDKKTTGIVAYLTGIGLIIALVLGDREGAKFHLNQALVIKPSSEGQLPSAQVRPKEMLQSDKIFCPYCGKKIQRNSNFCCFCGSKINYKK